MALLFMDGFDHMNQTNLIASGKWSSNTGLNTDNSTVRFTFTSSQSIQSASGSDYIERSIGSNLSAGILGIAMYITTGTLPGNIIPCILYDTTTIQMGLRINNDQTISVCRGTTGTVLGTSSAIVPIAKWFYIEFKWKISSSISSGDVQVNIDNTNVLSLSATTNTQSSANAYATKYRLGGDTTFNASSSIPRRYMDDHYLIDLTGSTNNTFLNSPRVYTIYPNGNGNSSQFTNQGGNSTNNFNSVKDSGNYDSDSTYIETNTVGNKDTYTISSIPSTTSTVYAVGINCVTRKTDTGTRTINGVVRMSTTDYATSASPSIASTYQNVQFILETRPSDSTAWTATDVNNAQFGVQVAS